MQLSQPQRLALTQRVQDIAQRLLARPQAAKDGLGLTGGKAGELLFWAHYGRHLQDKDATRLVADGAADLVEQLDATELHHSFSAGITGILWALQYLQQHDFVEEEFDFTDVDEAIMDFARQLLRAGDTDFLHGGTGHVAYLWQRFRVAPSDRLRAYLDECTRLLEAIAISKDNYTIVWKDLFSYNMRMPDMAGVSEFLNTGIAHGSASIVLLLSSFAARGVGGDVARRLATGGLRWLQDAETHTVNDRLPSQFLDGVPSGGGPIAWCYGELSHAYATLTCSQLLALPAERASAERYATELVSMSTQRPFLPNNAELCHGLAGIYMTIDRMARALPRASVAPLQQTMLAALLHYDLDMVRTHVSHQRPGQTDLRDYSLLSGYVGIGLTMLHILEQEAGLNASWPDCLLLY